MKVYFNNSCNICRAEINLYKKEKIEGIDWVDITHNKKAQEETKKEDKSLLRRLHVKKDGKIFLSFPNADSLKSKILNNKWDMVVPLAHLNFFSKKSIRISLEKNNFEIIYIANYSLADARRYSRNIIKLPFKLIKDLVRLDFKNFLLKIRESILTLIDIIDGDQMMVVAKKVN